MDINTIKPFDWECLEIDSIGGRVTDSDIDGCATRKRHTERMTLQSLPFLTENQNIRVNRLLEIRKRDNARIKKQLKIATSHPYTKQEN